MFFGEQEDITRNAFSAKKQSGQGGGERESSAAKPDKQDTQIKPKHSEGKKAHGIRTKPRQGPDCPQRGHAGRANPDKAWTARPSKTPEPGYGLDKAMKKGRTVPLFLRNTPA